MAVHVILLAGGSGKRLWPFSNEVRAKHSFPFFDTPQGDKESLIQRSYRHLHSVFPTSTLFVITSLEQSFVLKRDLPSYGELIIEPESRDTYAAVLYAIASIVEQKGCSDEDTILFLPSDAYADLSFYEALQKAVALSKKRVSSIVTVGVKPTYEATQYGYIQPENRFFTYLSVASFIEKPDKAKAHTLIDRGALWNTGVAAFSCEYALSLLEKEFNTTSFEMIKKQYNSINRTSFDYAVMEKEPSIAVVDYEGEWSDVGSWDTLSKHIPHDIGSTYKVEATNTQLFNELDVPLVAIGTKNISVAASVDGILVIDHDHADLVKEVADRLQSTTKVTEYEGGSALRIHKDETSETFVISLYPHKTISLEYKKNSTLTLSCISGEGSVEHNGKTQPLLSGQTLVFEKESTVVLQSSLGMRLIKTIISPFRDL
ncbi:MAG: sugar phosphate nucleotidyltransferase [Sphaerochaetaceae bacterium]